MYKLRPMTQEEFNRTGMSIGTNFGEYPSWPWVAEDFQIPEKMHEQSLVFKNIPHYEVQVVKFPDPSSTPDALSDADLRTCLPSGSGPSQYSTYTAYNHSGAQMYILSSCV